MSVNVDLAFTSSRGIVTSSPSIVAEQGNNNSGLVGLVLNILHVSTIGKVIHTAASAGVFILRLIENDWATLCDLSLGDGGSNVGNVAIRACQSLISFCPSAKAFLLVSSLQVGLFAGS